MYLEYDGRGLQVPDLDRIYRGPEEVRLFWREWFIRFFRDEAAALEAADGASQEDH